MFILRGKEFGHDVDFLVTTPELGKEENLLPSIITGLSDQVSVHVCVFLFLLGCNEAVDPRLASKSLYFSYI